MKKTSKKKGDNKKPINTSFNDLSLKNFFRSKALKPLLEKTQKLTKSSILSIWSYSETDKKFQYAIGLSKYKKNSPVEEKNIIKALCRENRTRIINIKKNTMMQDLLFIKNNNIEYLIVIPMKTVREKISLTILYSKTPLELSKEELNRLSEIINYEIILIHNMYMKKKIKILGTAVNIDGLTRLNDHRSFHETMIKEVSKANRFKYSLSVMMIDIDHFKKFNDTFGHLVGDKVLSIISDLIRNCIRAYDQAFRYGGEEIAVICPHTTRRQAITAAERIRKEIENYPFFAGGEEEKVQLTVSIGISSYPENANSKQKLIEKVDQALYLAKEEGRNRVCSSLISGKKMIKFGFCPPAFTSPFYLSVLKGIKDVMDEVSNIDLYVESPDRESDHKEQMNIIDRFIDMKVDSIAICSQEKQLLGKKIMDCNKAGIEVFMFNTTGDLSRGKVASYISYKNMEAGREVGRYIARLLRKRGKAAILEGLDDAISSTKRKQGFMEIINKYKNIKIVSSVKARFERDKARKETEKILKKHPDLDAIYAVSDEMALGAFDAVNEAGKGGEIFIIGLDGNPSALESIRNGELTATLNINAVGIGRALMRTVLRSKIKGEKIDKHIWLPIMIVDMENVNQYI